MAKRLILGLLIILVVSVPLVRANSTVTLNFWMPGQEPTIKSTMEGLIAKFEKINPGVKISYTQIPWNEYFVKLNTAYSGGVGPDVQGLGWGQFGQLVGEKRFLPLDAKSPGLKTSDIYDVIVDAGSYKGILYGLPLPEVRPLIYRKDYFKEAGLDPDDPPGNWKELQDYAIKLTKRSGDRVERAGLDVPTSNGIHMFATMILQQGEEMWDEDGVPLFDGKEGIKTLTYLVDLKSKYNTIIPSDMQSLTGPVFMNGFAAMAFMQSQALPDLEKKAPGKLGYALPTKEVTNEAFIGGTFLTVSATTKYKTEAVKLLEHLYSADSIWEIYKGINFLPTRKSLEKRFIDDDPEKNKVFSAALRNSKGYNKSPVFIEGLNVINRALEQAYYGKKTPEQALKDAANEVRALLKEKKK